GHSLIAAKDRRSRFELAPPWRTFALSRPPQADVSPFYGGGPKDKTFPIVVVGAPPGGGRAPGHLLSALPPAYGAGLVAVPLPPRIGTACCRSLWRAARPCRC